MRKSGLPPVVDENTEILILGTLPSDMSIAAGQYYANPGNDFWKLVEAALNQTLVGLPYEAKIECLKTSRIGLWDAYHSCVRLGSMDDGITEQELNDFGRLKNLAPSLKLICFNGQKAAKAQSALTNLGYNTTFLPSSSGANRRDQAERMRRWEVVIRFDTFALEISSKYNMQSHQVAYRVSLSSTSEKQQEVVRTYWAEDAVERALSLLDLPPTSIERALLVLAKNDYYSFPAGLRLNGLQVFTFALLA